MRKTSITSAGGLGVHIVAAKIASSPKRRPPRPANERDDESPEEQALPSPGMGKLVDKTI
ncbi:MAG TPA: hypothetical protein VLN61_07720 [Pseudolabrys sp.]|nr:hypothetical protein [Pseudolabrys sp.]